ncbi:hypothetical protein [Caulobacter sp. NIBR1757]|uniref:hypothetical protein n=1 Tax=Caulobacter sp. NIBR1757 TaxID=3016000 RepID=UPI0022F088FD|nr:hypothetical protein [Caulobacter sp. NIBR1757]WGM39776.1 hypothetical protein AMEJIAPC_02703 [Caulobacter sp. NIBR1757]
MKSLFYGIGAATLAGLCIGGVMRPTIAEGRIGGPQIALGDSGRVAYGDAEAATTSYPYGIPDYVIGTDNLYQAADYAATDEAYVDTAWRDAAPDLPVVEPASYTPATYKTASYDVTVHYPSQGGGILAGISNDEAPADLGPEVFEPADAPADAMAAFERDEAAPQS